MFIYNRIRSSEHVLQSLNASSASIEGERIWGGMMVSYNAIKKNMTLGSFGPEEQPKAVNLKDQEKGDAV